MCLGFDLDRFRVRCGDRFRVRVPFVLLVVAVPTDGVAGVLAISVVTGVVAVLSFARSRRVRVTG